ncbi:MAG: hypothetical protein E7261_06750 [Lachnospiraceae bacterium]|nr:hypothetical protein [Lachnospiraceae bacterium]
MHRRMAKFTITDAQIYLIAFVIGVILGVTFFQLKNDMIYPVMCLYQELRTDKLRRNDIVSASLLKYVAGERFKQFGILFLTQITVLRRVIAYIYCGVCGFSCAVLEAFYVQEYALKGLVFFFATLTPHYIFYVLAWFKMCSAKNSQGNLNKETMLDIVRILLMALMLLFIGIICESVFNVWILKKFL